METLIKVLTTLCVIVVVLMGSSVGIVYKCEVVPLQRKVDALEAKVEHLVQHRDEEVVPLAELEKMKDNINTTVIQLEVIRRWQQRGTEVLEKLDRFIPEESEASESDE